MADRPANVQLTVYGVVNLTFNHVEAGRATPGEAVRAACPEGPPRRARMSPAEIGSRWLLQVVAALTSSAAAAGLLSVLPID